MIVDGLESEIPWYLPRKLSLKCLIVGKVFRSN